MNDNEYRLINNSTIVDGIDLLLTGVEELSAPVVSLLPGSASKGMNAWVQFMEMILGSSGLDALGTSPGAVSFGAMPVLLGAAVLFGEEGSVGATGGGSCALVWSAAHCKRTRVVAAARNFIVGIKCLIGFIKSQEDVTKTRDCFAKRLGA